MDGLIIPSIDTAYASTCDLEEVPVDASAKELLRDISSHERRADESCAQGEQRDFSVFWIKIKAILALEEMRNGGPTTFFGAAGRRYLLTSFSIGFFWRGNLCRVWM